MTKASEGEMLLDLVAAKQRDSSSFARVELVRGDTIKPKPVSWLWKGYLAAAKVNIIAGAPSTGKTTLALSLAAAVSTGGVLPDGTRAPAKDVLIWSGEDSMDDVLVPRLMASGADMSRVHFVGMVTRGDQSQDFDPAKDLPKLRAEMMIGDKDWGLLIVDSIVSVTTGDTNSNGDVRKSLKPLGALAEETGCAVIGITHFSKGTAGRDPLERVSGSLAFGAYPRVVLATAKRDVAHGGGRIVARAKSNLGEDGGGFVYDIEQVAVPGEPGLFATRIAWGVPLEGSAREILADAEAEFVGEDEVRRSEVDEWLRTKLIESGGSLDKRIVMRDAKAAGFAERTVQRARERLRFTTSTSGFGVDKRSVWSIPHSCHANAIVPIAPRETAATDGGMNPLEACMPPQNVGMHGTIGMNDSGGMHGADGLAFGVAQ